MLFRGAKSMDVLLNIVELKLATRKMEFFFITRFFFELKIIDYLLLFLSLCAYLDHSLGNDHIKEFPALSMLKHLKI